MADALIGQPTHPIGLKIHQPNAFMWDAWIIQPKQPLVT